MLQVAFAFSGAFVERRWTPKGERRACRGPVADYASEVKEGPLFADRYPRPVSRLAARPARSGTREATPANVGFWEDQTFELLSWNNGFVPAQDVAGCD